MSIKLYLELVHENSSQLPDPEYVDWNQFAAAAHDAHSEYTDDLQRDATEQAAHLHALGVVIEAADTHAEALGLPSGLQEFPDLMEASSRYTDQEFDALCRADVLARELTLLPDNPKYKKVVLEIVGHTLYGLEDREEISAWLEVIRSSCAHYEADLDVVLGDDPELTILQAVAEVQRAEEDLDARRVPADLRDARWQVSQEAVVGLFETLGISPDHDEASELFDTLTSLCATDPNQPSADTKISLHIEDITQILSRATNAPPRLLEGVIEYINHIRTTTLELPPITISPDSNEDQ